MTIQQKKAEMLDFLRNELRNFKINLNVIISENEDSNRPYTGEEKYRAMLDKNPTLKELKDRLDLEVDL